jgi:hypothetical protein
VKTAGQSKIILDYFKARPGVEIPSVDLHRVASGKDGGWLNSLTRRISDVRQMLATEGQTVIMSRMEITASGERHSHYKMVPIADGQFS